MKRDGSKAQTAIHGLFDPKFLPTEKANAIAVWKIGSHDLCDERHEERVEVCVQALLEAEDDTATGRSDLVTYKNNSHSNLGKACGLDGIPNECLSPSNKTTGSANSFI
jgi:hypothetical protein